MAAERVHVAHAVVAAAAAEAAVRGERDQALERLRVEVAERAEVERSEPTRRRRRWEAVHSAGTGREAAVATAAGHAVHRQPCRSALTRTAVHVPNTARSSNAARSAAIHVAPATAARRAACAAKAAEVLEGDAELGDLGWIEAVDSAECAEAETELGRLSRCLGRLVLAATPAKADTTAADREALHALDRPLGVLLANELDEAAALAGRDLGVRDLAEGREKRLERLLGDETAEPADKDGRVVRVGRVDATGDARCRVVSLADATAAAERRERGGFGPRLASERRVDVQVASTGVRLLCRAEREGVAAGRDRVIRSRPRLLVGLVGRRVVRAAAATALGHVEGRHRGCVAEAVLQGLLLKRRWGRSTVAVAGKARQAHTGSEGERAAVGGGQLGQVLDRARRESTLGWRDPTRLLLLLLTDRPIDGPRRGRRPARIPSRASGAVERRVEVRTLARGGRQSAVRRRSAAILSATAGTVEGGWCAAARARADRAATLTTAEV